MMSEIFLPTFHSFAMGNVFTGSLGDFRFKVEPNIVKKSQKEVDFEQSTITAEYWHGMFCREMSQVEATEVFPLSEEGRAAMKQWLESHI